MDRNRLALSFARRSRVFLARARIVKAITEREIKEREMVEQGLTLLPYMLNQECQPGPSWEHPWWENLDDDSMFSEYLDDDSMEEWVMSCLTIGGYEGHHPLSGWSPFRSVCTNKGWFKAGDGGVWDIQLSKPYEDHNSWDPAPWWDMTLKFARVAGYMALKYFKHTTTLWELFERELEEMPSPMDEVISSWLAKTPSLSQRGILEILATHSVKAYYTARRMMLPPKGLIANSCFTSFAIALARTSRAQRIMISRCLMPRIGDHPSKKILTMLGF